eukprot:CAMPEP_0119011978 /NCGR_PEP_ID=MMETSP1176-20130426/6002_1 /TAXON_ID=265551 /ORGANISM="Synedropsis recta cf, Strain CCMP1620" /LENGTH=150 /DNA_ID=CAMNT_0006964867 /DNA_START=74 /DNA_END=526 /DNA_ORIENTATION=+
MVNILEKADEIAAKWGPALTKFAKGEGEEDFKSMWVKDIIPFVIDKDGTEATIAIGEEGDEPITMTWSVFQELLAKEHSSADFSKTEAECLGVLGNRMILEVSRFNNNDEVYMNAVSILTLTEDGLIAKTEAFGDQEAESITDTAQATES